LINRYDPANWLDILTVTGIHAGLVFIAIHALARHLRGAGGDLSHPRQRAALAILAAHLALATLMLGLMLKSGAADNYAIEWLLLLAVLCGLAFGAAPTGWIGRAVPWALAIQLGALLLFYTPTANDAEAKRADMEAILPVLRAAPGPVLSDDMVLLLRAGKPVEVESAIYAELTSRGVLDDRPLRARLAAHAFPVLLTEGGPGDDIFEDRYPPRLRAALLAAYPQAIRYPQGYVLRFPAGPLPAWLAGHAHLPA
jgi:hypothetical protein